MLKWWKKIKTISHQDTKSKTIHEKMSILCSAHEVMWCPDSGLKIFFQNWWAQVTHGAKNGGSISEMMGRGTNHSWYLGSILYLQTGMHIDCWLYSKPCLKGPLKKVDQLSLNAGQKYCRMLQGEHSAILLTFIKLPFVIKIFVLYYFEWLPQTCFNVVTTVLWSM